MQADTEKEREESKDIRGGKNFRPGWNDRRAVTDLVDTIPDQSTRAKTTT